MYQFPVIHALETMQIVDLIHLNFTNIESGRYLHEVQKGLSTYRHKEDISANSNNFTILRYPSITHIYKLTHSVDSSCQQLDESTS